MSANFKLVTENPNHNYGGCLCNEQGTNDSCPPYAAFFVSEMESVLSPIPVICGNCIDELTKAKEDFDEENAPEV